MHTPWLFTGQLNRLVLVSVLDRKRKHAYVVKRRFIRNSRSAFRKREVLTTLTGQLNEYSPASYIEPCSARWLRRRKRT